MKVKRVVSSTELELEVPNASISEGEEYLEYQIVPPVSHDEMFKAVHNHLGRKCGCLGIFPEGGSHDRTQLLPLKVGVCIMALGTLQKFPNCNVKLVPVGLNYFSQHKFNSRVLVKYGNPLSIDPLVIERYSKGGEEKRAAVADLLETVQKALAEVTVCAPDWKMLKTFWALRDLYVPSKRLLVMTSVDKVLLAQAFASDYDRVKDDPSVPLLLGRIRAYAKKLDALGMKDKASIESAVLIRTHSRFGLWCMLVIKSIRMAALHMLFLPVYLQLLPVYLVARAYALRKSREAVANSKVKILGKDVMGTYKLIVAFPMLATGHVLFSIFAWRVSDAAT